MPNFRRLLSLPDLLAKKSFFLFGPRATGKSFLVNAQLGDRALVIDLLRSDLYFRLSADPGLLEGLIGDRRGARALVVIDEVQKLPILLDEVHRLIESRGLRFLLTGSSARKLKRGQANLLAGRAWTAHLHPLTWAELPGFDLPRFLRWGGLPPVVASGEPAEELRAYVRTYLQEEILAEGFVRRLPQFSRFLSTAALTSGQMLNFAQIASDAGVPAATVREYYFLLEDTPGRLPAAGLDEVEAAQGHRHRPVLLLRHRRDPRAGRDGDARPQLRPLRPELRAVDRHGAAGLPRLPAAG